MNKISFFLFFINVVFAGDSNPEALEIMERVIAHPNPKTSISEVHLEIIKKREAKQSKKIELLSVMKNCMMTVITRKNH